MITRGHFVGYIIDELSDIQSRIVFRNKFGLTDAATILENFYLEILNITFEDAGFKNANIGSGNADTVDLISEGLRTVIQVTSSLDPEKIVKTCESYKQNQNLSGYSLKFLAIGNRQQKYGSTDVQNAIVGTNLNLETDIWDNKSILSEIINLSTDKLSKLYKLFKDNSSKLTIDLELPNEEGEFQNTLFSRYERNAGVQFNGIDTFIKFIETERFNGKFEDKVIEEYNEAFNCLIKILSELPRQTREFFTVALLEKSKVDYGEMHPHIRVLASIMERKLEMSPEIVQTEVQIITTISRRNDLREFCYVEKYEGDDSYYNYIRISAKIKDSEHFLHEVVDFIDSKKLSYEKIFKKLDFSDFA